MLNSERRAYPRIKLTIPIFVEVSGSLNYDVAMLRDISVGGMRVLSSNLAEGEAIECRILVPEVRDAVLRASVVSVTKGKGAGLVLQMGKHKICKTIDTLFDISGLCAASMVHIEDGLIKVKGCFGKAPADEMLMLVEQYGIKKVDLSSVASINVEAVVACFQSSDQYGVEVTRCSESSFKLLEETGFCNSRCDENRQRCSWFA